MVLLIVAAFLAVCGLPMILLGRSSQARAREIQSWERVPGTVTASSLDAWRNWVREKNTGGEYLESSYAPIVHYTYEVEGRRQEGTRIGREVNHRMDEASAQQIQQRYPVGATVTVVYNPKNPKDAYLEVKPTIMETLMSRGGYALLAIAVVLGIIGLVI